jgi:hypothetical protein
MKRRDRPCLEWSFLPATKTYRNPVLSGDVDSGLRPVICKASLVPWTKYPGEMNLPTDVSNGVLVRLYPFICRLVINDIDIGLR